MSFALARSVRLLGWCMVALAAPFSSAPAAAQVALLEQAEARLAAGDVAAARGLVADWWAAQARERRPGAERARGLHLRARLAVDPGAAEEDYLAVVLGHPTSPDAPGALLRLGQLLLAKGEHARSEGYLQRLLADHPGHPLHAEGYLWLARARLSQGKEPAACEAVRAGLGAASDEELRALLGVEDARCLGRGRPTAPSAPETPAGRFSVQLGAYRSPANAAAMIGHLRSRGLEPRLVSVPGSSLVRLRVGRFEHSVDAAALRAKLITQGLEAVIVDDVSREKPVRR